MSPCAGVVVAAQSVPSFLGLAKHWLKALAISVGGCQGFASSLVIPRVVARVSESRKYMYVSAALSGVICANRKFE